MNVLIAIIFAGLTVWWLFQNVDPNEARDAIFDEWKRDRQ